MNWVGGKAFSLQVNKWLSWANCVHLVRAKRTSLVQLRNHYCSSALMRSRPCRLRSRECSPKSSAAPIYPVLVQRHRSKRAPSLRAGQSRALTCFLTLGYILRCSGYWGPCSSLSDSAIGLPRRLMNPIVSGYCLILFWPGSQHVRGRAHPLLRWLSVFVHSSAGPNLPGFGCQRWRLGSRDAVSTVARMWE